MTSQVVTFDVAGTAVTIRHRLDGARLELVVERPGEARELVAHVVRPTRLSIRSHGASGAGAPADPAGPGGAPVNGWWPVGSRSGWGGSFEELATFTARPRYMWETPRALGSGVPAGELAPPHDPAAFACRAHLRAVARALHERLDPDALRVAQAFPPSQRWWHYAAALDDPSGRVAQLAATCPGALVLARDHASAFDWCGRPDHDRAARRIVADAVAGLPLRRLVARSVERWAAVPATDPAGALRRALATTPPSQRDALLARQRLLVRRAGPHVRGADLARPGLVAFAPEDIPRGVVENRRWYFATSLAAEALALGPPGPREALSRFASRHALLLHGWAHRDLQLLHHARAERALDALAFRLATYCDATGRRPTLRGDPVAFLEDAVRWHEAAAPARRLEALLARVGALGLGEVTAVRALGEDSGYLWRVTGLPYPAPPEAAPDRGLVVEPIRSHPELDREGELMGHCVADLLPSVTAGDAFVYRVRSEGGRYTLAIRRHGDGGLRILELRGRFNAGAPLAVWRRVTRWVERLAPARPSSSPPAPPPASPS